MTGPFGRGGYHVWRGCPHGCRRPLLRVLVRTRSSLVVAIRRRLPVSVRCCRRCRVRWTARLDRPVRTRPPGPPYLRHRPVQLPMRLLHAGRGLRARLRLPAALAGPGLRGGRQAGCDLRRAGRAQAPDHRRRAPRATRPAGAHRVAGAAEDGRWRAGRSHADHERVRTPTPGGSPRGRGPAARHRQPRLARRRGVRGDERRGLPGGAGAGRGVRGEVRRPGSDQDQHGRAARAERGIGAAAGAVGARRGVRPPVHRVHGRRALQRLAPGRRRAGGRDPGPDRRRAAAGARGPRVSGRGGRSLPLPGRVRRSGPDRLGHAAVLRGLHARAAVGRGTPVHVPVRGRRRGSQGAPA